MLVLNYLVGEKPQKAGHKNTYELGHEGNHEIEKTDGLDESETKNGIGEKLATEGGVAGNTVQESGENETDTNTGTSETDGSGTHTKVLGDLDHGVGDLRGVGTLLGESGALGSVDDGGHLLALDGLHGGSLAGDCNARKIFCQIIDSTSERTYPYFEKLA